MCARNAVTSAIESAINGDAETLNLHIVEEGSQTAEPQKNTNKSREQNRTKRPCLLLPPSLDAEIHKVAAVVDHFNGKTARPPSEAEIKRITRRITSILSDPATNGLPASDLYTKYIAKDDVCSQYKGPGWEEWFILRVNHIAAGSCEVEPDNTDKFWSPIQENAFIKYPELEQFVHDLSCLTTYTDDPVDIVKSWYKVMTCTSTWCPLPIWWCVGAVLAGAQLDGVTRSCDGITVAAISLHNWDFLSIIKLLMSGIFGGKVQRAANAMNDHTRRDIAHERFDCDWHRDWICMLDLLDAFDCATEAAALRKFCEPRNQTASNG